MTTSEYIAERSPAVKKQTAIWFAVGIAAIGAVMMTLTSAPAAKGASFLWLPAALQLMAGVWLGPWLGLLSGGLGAYAAGILSYGGWGIVDFIQNPIAGGIANAMLPALLFRWLRIDPTLGANPRDVLKAAGRVGLMLMLVLIAAFGVKWLNLGLWGHLVTLAVVLLTPLVVRDLELNTRHFILAFVVVIVCMALSAFTGMFAWVVGGKTWQAAFFDLGIGWFSGDVVSAVLGLYLLAALTQRAS